MSDEPQTTTEAIDAFCALLEGATANRLDVFGEPRPWRWYEWPLRLWRNYRFWVGMRKRAYRNFGDNAPGFRPRLILRRVLKRQERE